MNYTMSDAIERFLDAFLMLDNRVGIHNALKSHYRRLFRNLIPRHFLPLGVPLREGASSHSDAIEYFLSEFLYEDNRVGAHDVIKVHYRELFAQIIPLYFVPVDRAALPTPTSTI